jgi:putative transposase
MQHAEPLPKHEQFGKPTIGSIPTILRSFKSAITKRINILRGTPGIPVWQRNYYEHVIRNEKSLNEIADYITNNPARWETDELFLQKF